ncbi:hypothetical protein AB0C76_15360 [Kitasatospora sp. NPDC048722]|uniref:hypothetical protein n=1 Tax=Kitasatospora sp. NPDC048722 TaxID=3155639 RepID=UPI0033D877F9
MDEHADARRVIDDFFAEREALARSRVGFPVDADDIRARRERFARTGRLAAGEVLQVRMWAVNRALAAVSGEARPSGAVEEVVREYRIVTRWVEEQSRSEP